MNLEVGMYVRTFQGIIGKIKCFNNERKTNFNTEKDSWITIDGVKNVSYSIIELIEVGDYVNGKLVRIVNYIDKIKNEKCIWCGDNETSPKYEFFEKDIKSIVTKEQFENMSYKVGE